ncbi:hypothetical protein IV203_018031 [Nitzschia inconspicua]|uniref:NAD(P)-binding domain-containing protein n=1 Tax=Nitzschia inconspicua TaxID=303405 RepID=A0A9K3M194_9STRA|nr:hypothetical protein IV203_018031 [Nitzschia inconspicua]
MINSSDTTRRRILIVGASSDTGAKLVYALSEQVASKRPIIFAFCDSPDDIEKCTKERCNGVIRGDFQSQADITRAMEKSMANTVIFIPRKIAEEFRAIVPASREERSKNTEESDFQQPLPSNSHAAIDAVMRRKEYTNVTFFILETKTLEEKKNPTEQSIPTRKTRRKGHILEGALEGMAQFLRMKSISSSISNEFCTDSSERSLKATTTTSPLQKWRKRRIKTTPSMESKETCASTIAEADIDSIAPASIHIKVVKRRLVDFVVGAVMDNDRISSLKGINHPRDITVTAE